MDRHEAEATRIAVLPAARFAQSLDEFAREGRPAIVTGLFDGQAFAGLGSIDRARELLGGMPLGVYRNFADSKEDEVRRFLVGRKHRAERREMRFDAFLDLAARSPGDRSIIAEGPAPKNLLELADLRPLGITRMEGGYYPEGAARPAGEARAVLFVGNGGNAADLHTDWDGHDVLLYQGFGRKRVTVFPAAAAPLLRPIGTFGTIRLSGMAEAARRAFLAYAGGAEHLLMPGETLFMPAFCWHNIEYLDLALSVSIRFNGVRDPDMLFPIGHLHQDFYLQNLMAASRDPAKSAGIGAAMRELRAAYDRPYPSARAKYRALHALARSRAVELGLFARSHPRQTWLDFDDLLDGTECAAYHFLPAGSGAARWWWHSRERARSQLRRWANRVAHWA